MLNITRRCCIGLETLLKLIVSKFDKRVVLFGQLKRQNPIVLFADFRFSLLEHSLTNEAHLNSNKSRENLYESNMTKLYYNKAICLRNWRTECRT